MSTTARILGSIATISLLVSAFPASAASLTSAQVDAVVALLKSFGADQNVITQVQNDLSVSIPGPSCYTFAANVGQGSTGPAVTALQTFLRTDGENVSVTGSYDEQTVLAVIAFQEKHASEILQPLGLAHGTGLAGAATRTLLNKLYGCAAGSQPGVGVASSTQSIAVVTGPARGGLDYNNDGQIDQADVQFLLDVAVGAHVCPGDKICDLDKDGRTVASDALVLANYIGSVAKPGQLDYNNDLKIDVADARELQRILVSGTACPTGKICDVGGDALFNNGDEDLLLSYVGR